MTQICTHYRNRRKFAKYAQFSAAIWIYRYFFEVARPVAKFREKRRQKGGIAIKPTTTQKFIWWLKKWTAIAFKVLYDTFYTIKTKKMFADPPPPYVFMDAPFLTTIPPKQPVIFVIQISRFKYKASIRQRILKNSSHFRL